MMKKKLKELKYTILGLSVWVITGVYFFLPYFLEQATWIPLHYEVTGGFIGGLLLMLAPDRFIDFLFNWMNRKKP